MKSIQFRQYSISKLSLGTIQLGMNYGISNTSGTPSSEQAFNILDMAREAGINTFDTARTYGSSETVLGNYFHDKPLGNDVLVSKFKYEWTAGLDIETAWKTVKSSVIQSLTELKITQLPIVLYHKGPIEPMEEVLRIVPNLIERLKEGGYIAHGGVSLYYSMEARLAMESDTFEVLQIPLHILDQEIVRDGTLGTLHDAGKLLFIRSVFLQGLLFRNPTELDGVLRQAIPYLSQLRILALDSGRSIADIAFSFIRDLPQADSLVVGAETPQQVAENLNLLNSPLLSDSLKSELLKLAIDIPKEVITPGLWK